MVTFDELRISENGKCLIIECRIEDYDMYEEMYIDSVYLEYYKYRGVVGVPSEHAMELYKDEIPVNSDIRGAATEHKRHLRFRVDVDSIAPFFGISEFRRQLFYVYVQCAGTPTGEHAAEMESRNCTWDNTLDVAVVVDWKSLYEKIMPLVAKYASNCSGCDLPTDFETMILLWNAFRFAVDVCDYEQLERIWEELMGLESTGHMSSDCGCRG